MLGIGRKILARNVQPSRQAGLPNLALKTCRSGSRAYRLAVFRTGTNRRLPLFDSPPPITTLPGFNRFEALATPIPSQVIAVCQVSSATGSPDLAASATCLAVIGASSPDFPAVSANCCWYSLEIDRPEASDSRQPRRPHGHSGPPG